MFKSQPLKGGDVFAIGSVFLYGAEKFVPRIASFCF